MHGANYNKNQNITSFFYLFKTSLIKKDKTVAKNQYFLNMLFSKIKDNFHYFHVYKPFETTFSVFPHSCYQNENKQKDT